MVYLGLACWVNITVDVILKYFSYFFSQKIGSDISYKLSPKETICMKCLILFPGKSKKNILNLLSAEIARNMLSVKGLN